jgi:uncharacterized protein YfaS (alpha-2-macroglobulin family)
MKRHPFAIGSLNSLLLVVCMVLGAERCVASEPMTYDAQVQRAETFFAEGSFRLAMDVYDQLRERSDITAEQARWVAFRFHDCALRDATATQSRDDTAIEEARNALTAMVRDVQRESERDSIWAMVHESLGDSYWYTENYGHWSAAQQHYQLALDWWASSTDLDVAREHYLGMVWKMAEPPHQRGSFRYMSFTHVPETVLDNAVAIAQRPDDRARAMYYRVRSLMDRHRSEASFQRIETLSERILNLGRQHTWYDDTLFAYADWCARLGKQVHHDNGQISRKPDYVKALALFQRLIAEFPKGSSAYYDDAQSRIASITREYAGVAVPHAYLPGSHVQYVLRWRNVETIALAVYPVDLTTDFAFQDGDERFNEWLQRLAIDTNNPVRKWTYETGDDGTHEPGQATLHLDQLEPGAYVITTHAGGESNRDLILVSQTTTIAKTSDDDLMIYTADALSSAPMAAVTHTIWRSWYDGNRWRISRHDATADADGLCQVRLDALGHHNDHRRTEFFITSKVGDQQTLNWVRAYRYMPEGGDWRLYTMADRPAYRPGETVEWKVIARVLTGLAQSTPSSQTIQWQIVNPRGEKVAEGSGKLNTFGSMWDSLELTDDMPLGMYKLLVKTPADRHFRDRGDLFRLEEYKLPEFQVSVRVPTDAHGQRKIFRSGDEIEVDINASYYFGGPVADASVEVMVTSQPYYMSWALPHDYPWCYESNDYYRGYYGRQVVMQETIRTDDNGIATLRIQSPDGPNNDLQYTIEARVTDASRREIVGTGTVRVTQQSYFTFATPKRYLYEPGETVTVDFRTMDANHDPVARKGTVTVTRLRWEERWLDPRGEIVYRDELPFMPLSWQSEVPTDKAGLDPWRLQFRGYVEEDVLKQTVETDETGTATFTYTTDVHGYYRVRWVSPDPPVDAVQTDCMVWVTTHDSTDIGFHSGLQIILDTDTVKHGDSLPVMLVTPANNRHVLLTTEGTDLHSVDVVHVSGNVKLLQIPIEDAHLPNFYINAMLPFDGSIQQNMVEVTVPPTEQYINVSVQPDREAYQPGDEATLNITTTDQDGRPVSAEVALATVDSSVFYIQPMINGDPRAFFFGDRQHLRVNTSTMEQWHRFVKLVETPSGEVMTENQWEHQRLRELQSETAQGGGGGGFAGGGLFDSPDDASLERLASNTAVAGSPPVPASRAGGRDRARGESMLGLEMEEKAGYAFEADAAEDLFLGEEPGVGDEGGPIVEVRTDFRSTIFWNPNVRTDKDGKATVTVKYADSLTTWQSTAVAITAGAQSGMAQATTRTRLPLIVRLQAPRFFVEGDVITLSAVLNNNTTEDMTVTVEFEADGLGPVQAVRDQMPPTREPKPTALIPAQGEVRLDWVRRAYTAGDARIRVTAMSREYADAMEKTYPVYEHGIERFLLASARMDGDELQLNVMLPEARRDDSTQFVVQVTPSLAVTMLDALPYLIDYPYGCTEQTMSRFLPTVITAKTLRDLGLDPNLAMARTFGGIEAVHAAKTHPKGKKHLDDINKIAQASLDRLYDFHHGDGGWGWWKKGDSDHFMTAYVLWGLTLATEADLDVKPQVLDRAADWLEKELVEAENQPDLQAWMLHALSAYGRLNRATANPQYQDAAFNNLLDKRNRLNAYTRSLLALSAHDRGDADNARLLLRNLINGVKRDTSPDTSVVQRGMQQGNAAAIGTAHWGSDGVWWRWSESPIEATSTALRAFLAIDPDHELIAPITNWLLKNRRGAQWSNTRDTAMVVLAMNDYLRTSGELETNIAYEVQVNGLTIASQTVTADDIFAAPSRFTVDRELLRDGINEVRVIRTGGRGPLYLTTEATYFSLEEPIPPAGNEIFVRREYFKYVPKQTLLKGVVYECQPLADGDRIVSGQRVDVVITIESKNDLEYLLFEDLKPAGLEAVQIQSGSNLFARELKQSGIEHRFGEQPGDDGAGSAVIDRIDYTGHQRWVYQELRDRKVAMFIDKLPEGVWEIRYRMRAEVPGRFHALPVLGHAMYVPEIRCNGAEVRMTVADRDDV